MWIFVLLFIVNQLNYCYLFSAPPAPPILSIPSQISQDNFQLSVEPGYDGLSPILGYHLTYKIEGSTTNSTMDYTKVPQITLLSLRSNSLYMINVSARNRLGLSSPATVLVKTKSGTQCNKLYLAIAYGLISFILVTIFK